MTRDIVLNYWEECISNAAEDCGLAITPEQVTALANDVKSAHENYGMAFYSPPSTDRIQAIEREGNAKAARVQAEFDAYQRGAEKAMKRALRLFSDVNISINEKGEVHRYGGRITQIL